MESILIKFRDLAYERGLKIMLLVMPHLIDIKLINKQGYIPYDDFFSEINNKMPLLDLTSYLKSGNIKGLYTEDIYGGHFSELGNKVVCVDKNKSKIENLKKGIIPIFEPGLQELVTKNYKANRLNFTADSKDAINNSDIVTCVSKSLKDDTIDFFKIKREIKVIPNFIDIKKYNEKRCKNPITQPCQG